MNSLLIDAKSLTEWFQSINKKEDKNNTKDRVEEFEIRLKQINKQLFDAISYRLSLSALEIRSISDNIKKKKLLMILLLLHQLIHM
jgi:hypothetical protein